MQCNEISICSFTRQSADTVFYIRKSFGVSQLNCIVIVFQFLPNKITNNSTSNIMF